MANLVIKDPAIRNISYDNSHGYAFPVLRIEFHDDGSAMQSYLNYEKRLKAEQQKKREKRV